MNQQAGLTTIVHLSWGDFHSHRASSCLPSRASVGGAWPGSDLPYQFDATRMVRFTDAAQGSPDTLRSMAVNSASDRLALRMTRSRWPE